MKILSRLFSMQGYLQAVSRYFIALDNWTHNPVFRTINVPCPPCPPNPHQVDQFDVVHVESLVASGGEREFYDYIKAVIDNKVVAADRVEVSDAKKWESEHYQIANQNGRVEFKSIRLLDSSSIPTFQRSHTRDTNKDRYLVGPDGTWRKLSEGAKLGAGSKENNLYLKLRVAFAQSAIENETMEVSLDYSGGCYCSIAETLTVGHPEITVRSIKPLDYVTQEEFDANFELALPGSLLDHQERLKERVTQLFRNLMATEDRLPPSSRLTGEFRLDNFSRKGSIRLATSTTRDFIEHIHDYDEQQSNAVIQNGAFPVYMKVGELFVVGFTETGLEWLTTMAWGNLSILERLELYVLMLSLYQHNHLGDYGITEIYNSLDDHFATKPA